MYTHVNRAHPPVTFASPPEDRPEKIVHLVQLVCVSETMTKA